MDWNLLHISILCLVLLTGCVQNIQSSSTETRTFTIGAIAPLTGPGAQYGSSVQGVVELAVREVNADWKDKGQRLEIIWEDGACNGKDALSAAQKLVNIHNVDVIYGGVCSGETLGFASFTEQNKILVLSPVSGSPDVRHAGDFVFRLYPSSDDQIDVFGPFIQSHGHTKIAILSENTDFAQALREQYIEYFSKNNIHVVMDEVVSPGTKDVLTEVSKIKSSSPDAVIVLPQTIPTGGIFAKQLFEANIGAEFYGNDITAYANSVNEFTEEFNNYYMPGFIFDKQNDSSFLKMQRESGCTLDYTCATSYDGILLLSEALDACGDSNTLCLRDFLYHTKDWRGPFAQPVTFDEFGDVPGIYTVRQFVDGEFIQY